WGNGPKRTTAGDLCSGGYDYDSERLILAKIGFAFPWLGDPYAIPLSRLPNLYLDAERLNVWRLGKEDHYEGADQQHEQQVVELRKKARRAKVKMKVKKDA